MPSPTCPMNYLNYSSIQNIPLRDLLNKILRIFKKIKIFKIFKVFKTFKIFLLLTSPIKYSKHSKFSLHLPYQWSMFWRKIFEEKKLSRLSVVDALSLVNALFVLGRFAGVVAEIWEEVSSHFCFGIKENTIVQYTNANTK